MSRVLIIGVSGLVGKAIWTEMIKDEEFDVYGTFFNNSLLSNKDKILKLAIDDQPNITEVLSILEPQIVISCTRGDYKDQLSFHRKIAEYLKKLDGRLYFCSSANVFDNDLSKPHYEYDTPNSMSNYGQFKIECEKILIEILHENSYILRFPQIWGKDSPRMKSLLNSASQQVSIEVYPELFLTTNTDFMLAKQVYYIIKHKLKGIFHLTTADIISQRDFYQELLFSLGYGNAKTKESFMEKGYFSLLSERLNEFPEWMHITNKSVINYLSQGVYLR